LDRQQIEGASPGEKELALQHYREQRRKSARKYNSLHADQIAAQKQRWRKKHRDRLRIYKREYESTARKDPLVKLVTVLRSRMADAITAAMVKGRKIRERGAMRFVGCAVLDLAAHLESQFLDGMTWQNYGRTGWHVDHIFPVGKADLADPAHLRAAFNWRNCRPMWGGENLKKSDRVSREARAMFDQLVEHFRGGGK
jgi:hypothetical protein